MNRMKKAFAILLCLLILLSGCSRRTLIEGYAQNCWHQIGPADADIDEIFVIRYTSRTELCDDVLDTPMYQKIPERGYAVLFHSYGSPSFHDSYACFLDTEGKLAFCFDYEENHRLYEAYYEQFSIFDIGSGELAVEYLTNCNYIAGMINDADGEDYRGKLEKNVWYALSDDQIEWILRK